MREFTVPLPETAPPVGGLADVIFAHAADDPDRVVLSRKAGDRWQDVTSAQFRDEVLAVAKGLLAQGVGFGDRVAIMCRTRYEWTLFDFALWAIGAQSVPVPPTSLPEQVLGMLYEAEVSACMVESEDHAMTVGSVIGRLPRLTRLWQLDAGAVNELVMAGGHLDTRVVHRHRLAVTPDFPATIVYTPGTTGRPKGCVITHANLMDATDVLITHWEQAFRAKPGVAPSSLLFLPLAHIFGRVIALAGIRSRVRLGHHPDLTAATLLPELAAFRPTLLPAVPYLFEKVFHTARRKAGTEGRTGSFDKAVEVAVRYAEARERKTFGTGSGPGLGLRVRHRLFDRFVYRRVRAAMGGRVQYAISGGSALEQRLSLFFRGAGVVIHESYGLTESTAAATITPLGRPRCGTAGRPAPGTTVRIADDGEVWLRGSAVFHGYLGGGEATGTVLRDGWLATGDLGSLDEEGYLAITGRKQEVLMASAGQAVSPLPLEERVRSHPLVAQCLVVGNGRPYIAALITLDQEAVEHWLRVRGKPELSPSELVRDPDLEAEIRQAVVAASTPDPQTEPIRTFRILAARFSEERGLITSSMKLKRTAIENAYAAEVEALYPD